MIRATIFRTDNKITAFELTGHAESGPHGYDLVCAGVSAVSFGAVNAVLKICDINLTIEQGDEGGYLYVALPDTMEKGLREKAQLLFEGMFISLETIANEYGQFIMIQSK